MRKLEPSGKIIELTWQKPLADGSTIIDVMSPSVAIDGESIMFAGRTSRNPRWRIYKVAMDGSHLEQITGLTGDSGCVATPPLRFQSDGSQISDQKRRAKDYDDVDPTDLGPNGFAFASSRLPDLGRDHSRRATQIWVWPPSAKSPVALTANRNNDRWPVLLSGEQILFSLWSRNREAVTADFTDVRPVSEGGEFATRPTNNWMAAVVMTNAAQFGYAIKSTEPVWKPRPLFNGKIVYMTRFSDKSPLRLFQADWGYIRTSPSSAADPDDLPVEGGAGHYPGPAFNESGNPIQSATPSPAPPNQVLLAAAEINSKPENFGIYYFNDNWQNLKPKARLLFDDPTLVDAEPVAVYPRKFIPDLRKITPVDAEAYSPPSDVKLFDGNKYAGPMGYLENIAMSTAIRNPIPWHDRSDGKPIDPLLDPVVAPPPSIASVAVYSAGRDRFDDQQKLRITGDWKKLIAYPLSGKDDFSAWVPSLSNRVTVLVGLDESGKIAQWESPASSRRPSKKYTAYAGDHYSSIRPGSYNYCNGCHTGHSFTVIDPTERRAESGFSLLKSR
ncbi:MAG: hypothetical protein ACKO5E_04420 [bacterium]